MLDVVIFYEKTDRFTPKGTVVHKTKSPLDWLCRGLIREKIASHLPPPHRMYPCSKEYSQFWALMRKSLRRKG
jgi:hypothetical protein